MQKLPEAPDRKKYGAYAKKEPSHKKKEAHALSAVSSRVTTHKSILLLVEGTMYLSFDDALANLSTSSCHLFYDPRLKTPNKTPRNGLKTQNNGHISLKASNTLLMP